MELAALIQAIDGIVSLATVVGNAAGAADQVGAIISARIASGATSWTDEQRAQIEAALQTAKARAEAAAAQPDAA